MLGHLSHTSYLILWRKEVNYLNKKPIRIGIVSIISLGENHWTLRYCDPRTRRDIRKRFEGLSDKAIKKIASHISQEALLEKGYLPGKPPEVPTIYDALAEAIRLSNTRDYVRLELTRQ